MKISELIKKLQSHKDEFGDLDVYVPTDWEGYQPMDSVCYCVVNTDNKGNPLQVGIVVDR